METWLVQIRWDDHCVPRRILRHLTGHSPFVCALECVDFVAMGIAVQVEAESLEAAQFAALGILNQALEAVDAAQPTLIRFEVDNVAELDAQLDLFENNVIELGAYMRKPI